MSKATPAHASSAENVNPNGALHEAQKEHSKPILHSSLPASAVFSPKAEISTAELQNFDNAGVWNILPPLFQNSLHSDANGAFDWSSISMDMARYSRMQDFATMQDFAAVQYFSVFMQHQAHYMNVLNQVYLAELERLSKPSEKSLATNKINMQNNTTCASLRNGSSFIINENSSDALPLQTELNTNKVSRGDTSYKIGSKYLRLRNRSGSCASAKAHLHSPSGNAISALSMKLIKLEDSATSSHCNRKSYNVASIPSAGENSGSYTLEGINKQYMGEEVLQKGGTIMLSSDHKMDFEKLFTNSSFPAEQIVTKQSIAEDHSSNNKVMASTIDLDVRESIELDAKLDAYLESKSEKCCQLRESLPGDSKCTYNVSINNNCLALSGHDSPMDLTSRDHVEIVSSCCNVVKDLANNLPCTYMAIANAHVSNALLRHHQSTDSIYTSLCPSKSILNSTHSPITSEISECPLDLSETVSSSAEVTKSVEGIQFCNIVPNGKHYSIKHDSLKFEISGNDSAVAEPFCLESDLCQKTRPQKRRCKIKPMKTILVLSESDEDGDDKLIKDPVITDDILDDQQDERNKQSSDSLLYESDRNEACHSNIGPLNDTLCLSSVNDSFGSRTGLSQNSDFQSDSEPPMVRKGAVSDIMARYRLTSTHRHSQTDTCKTSGESNKQLSYWACQNDAAVDFAIETFSRTDDFEYLGDNEMHSALDLTTLQRQNSIISRPDNNNLSEINSSNEYSDKLSDDGVVHDDTEYAVFDLSSRPGTELTKSENNSLSLSSNSFQSSVCKDPNVGVAKNRESKITEYRCNICSYIGRSRYHLDRHHKAHSVLNKICRYCQKAFERPSDLARHEERHRKRSAAAALVTSTPVVEAASEISPDSGACTGNMSSGSLTQVKNLPLNHLPEDSKNLESTSEPEENVKNKMNKFVVDECNKDTEMMIRETSYQHSVSAKNEDLSILDCSKDEITDATDLATSCPSSGIKTEPLYNAVPSNEQCDKSNTNIPLSLQLFSIQTSCVKQESLLDVTEDNSSDLSVKQRRKLLRDDSSVRAYRCSRCRYYTDELVRYEQHLRAHSGRFVCKFCSKACIKSSDLYRHWLTHNVKAANGHYACDSCSFSAPTKDAVEIHMKQHYLIKPLLSVRMQESDALSTCGICNTSVPRGQLFEHKRSMHGHYLKQSASSVTDIFNEYSSSAKKERKLFRCPACTNSFTSPSYVLRHHFIVHQNNHVGPSEEGGETQAACRCRFCSESFETVELLYKHEIDHVILMNDDHVTLTNDDHVTALNENHVMGNDHVTLTNDDHVTALNENHVMGNDHVTLINVEGSHEPLHQSYAPGQTFSSDSYHGSGCTRTDTDADDLTGSVTTSSGTNVSNTITALSNVSTGSEIKSKTPDELVRKVAQRRSEDLQNLTTTEQLNVLPTKPTKSANKYLQISHRYAKCRHSNGSYTVRRKIFSVIKYRQNSRSEGSMKKIGSLNSRRILSKQCGYDPMALMLKKQSQLILSRVSKRL